ncbi:MAG: D-aminoacyl-tRNA deacylase [Eubacteriales bacterium]|jgi:D-tyrosyl-tRNA(Tyr) deacylase
MIAVIQRVKSSSVTIAGQVVGQIGQGFNVLLGVQDDDQQEDLDFLVKKIPMLRVFEDDEGKMNRSLLDVNGEMLVISQFTLLADCRRGNRPSFIHAARPEVAIPYYEAFLRRMEESGVRRVAHGEFGADMQVDICNDGPVTIVLNSRDYLDGKGRGK